MKKSSILLAGFLVLALSATALAQEGQKAKRDKAAKSERTEKSVPAQLVLKRFDKDANGKISGDEATALRQAFAGKRHDALKALDKNSDGKLDDAEIAAITAKKQPAKRAERPGKRVEKQGKKRKEK
ncbi:MAG: hypothetical protein HYY23_20400 [Verrucomicrobia bacterium]|nr:hypothetical protein [Verrucomicrobiota bacterium]